MTGIRRVLMFDAGARAPDPADKGHEPMKKTAGKVDLIVLKGDGGVEGTAIKQRAVEVLMYFAAMVLDLRFENLDNVYVLKGLNPSVPGDPVFMKEKVFRKVDIYGTTDVNSSRARAEKLVSVYNTVHDDDREKVGIAVLKSCLSEMYTRFDVSQE